MTKFRHLRMSKKRLLKEMNGQETWTNAFTGRFDERVCVGVEDGKVVHGGQRFVPTDKETNELWDDFIEGELGSKEQRAKEFEAEFGKKKEYETPKNRAKFEDAYQESYDYDKEND